MKKILCFITLLFLSMFFTFTTVQADEELKDIVYTGSSQIYKSKDGILNKNIIIDHVKESVIINNINTLSVVISKDTFTGNGANLGDYEFFITLMADGYNDLSLALNIKVVNSFAADYYMNNTFYTSKPLEKVDLLNCMKAVGLCPNVDLNISFKSVYFEVDDNDRKNYVSFLCNYDYTSASGYVDSGSFYIKVVDTVNSDIIYNSNSDLIPYIIIFSILFGVVFLAVIIALLIIKKNKKGRR